MANPSNSDLVGEAEAIARSFHERYEALAPGHGWETQERSQTAWSELPEANRSLMLAVVSELLRDGVIGPAQQLEQAEQRNRDLERENKWLHERGSGLRARQEVADLWEAFSHLTTCPFCGAKRRGEKHAETCVVGRLLALTPDEGADPGGR